VEHPVPPLTVRDAAPDEAGAIRDITLAAYEQYAAALPPPFWEAYRDNIVRTLARPGAATQIVAERSGALVGAVLLYPADAAIFAAGEGPPPMRWPEVRLLAVPPSARGLGVGAALMRECVARARRDGADRLALHTTPMMAAALRLYTRMGFARAPELDFSPAPGFDVHGYALALA
jgi:GNAT superfamily N-acetyltransferase